MKGESSSSLLLHRFRDGTYLLRSRGGREKIIWAGGSSRIEYSSSGRDYQGDGDVEREDVRNVTRLSGNPLCDMKGGRGRSEGTAMLGK